MKRLTAVFLCLIILVSFAACGSDVRTSTDAVPSTTDPNTEIKITVPMSYITYLSLTQERYKDNLQLYCEDNGFLSYSSDEANDKVTFTMTAFTYNGMISKKGFNLINSIGQLMESETYPYFKNLGDYNDNFSYVELLVDARAYEKDEFSSQLPAYIADICMHNYQLFTTTADYSCTVAVKNAKNGKVISEKTYTSQYNS